jgi:hypothetical protein
MRGRPPVALTRGPEPIIRLKNIAAACTLVLTDLRSWVAVLEVPKKPKRDAGAFRFEHVNPRCEEFRFRLVGKYLRRHFVRHGKAPGTCVAYG